MSKKVKIILTALTVFLVIVVSVVVYRLFFQFKNSDVKSYITQAASKYANAVTAEKILHDSVTHILSSRSLTKQVLDYAGATGMNKEQVLVTAALNQAKSYDYL